MFFKSFLAIIMRGQRTVRERSECSLTVLSTRSARAATLDLASRLGSLLPEKEITPFLQNFPIKSYNPYLTLSNLNGTKRQIYPLNSITRADSTQARVHTL